MFLRNGHAAYVFDVPARYRLLVGDDGQCFHYGAGIPRRTLFLQAAEPFECGLRDLEPPAFVGMHQLQSAVLPAGFQGGQHVYELVGRQRRHAQFAHGFFAQRFGLGQQGGFDKCIRGKRVIHDVFGFQTAFHILSGRPSEKRVSSGSGRLKSLYLLQDAARFDAFRQAEVQQHPGDLQCLLQAFAVVEAACVQLQQGTAVCGDTVCSIRCRCQQ